MWIDMVDFHKMVNYKHKLDPKYLIYKVDILLSELGKPWDMPLYDLQHSACLLYLPLMPFMLSFLGIYNFLHSIYTCICVTVAKHPRDRTGLALKKYC